MVWGAVVSAAASYAASKKANSASKDMNQRQMDFQERMSNTAHQRQVNDLKTAGLNPILSANSGASAPAGGTGTGAKMDQTLDMENIAAQIENTQANTAAVKQTNRIKEPAARAADFAVKTP